MIIHRNYREIEAEIVPEEEGAKLTTIRWLISKKEGASNFAMRLFEVKNGGYTPYHQHDWEHEIFILEGEGKLITEGREETLKPGEFLFIPPMEWHQFKNESDGILKFLCLIPIKD